MVLDVTSTVPAPPRPTPPLSAATQPPRADRSTPPRWLERLRRDPLYSTITLVVDVFYATFAVALAQRWTPGAAQAGDIALHSWFFVPIVIVLLAARSMYRRKLESPL